MFDTLSFTQIDGQHAELLPARTVMSLFGAHGGGGTSHCSASNGDFTQSGIGDVALLNNVNLLNGKQALVQDLIPIGILQKTC